MGFDPYRSPVEQTLEEVENLQSDDLLERFRREEMAILAVGWFYYFLGSMLVAVGGCLAWGYFILGMPLLLVPGALCFLMGPVYVITGYGLRRFDVWARWPSMVAAVVAVFIPPVGLFAGLLCFYLLCQNAARSIFTLQYQAALIEEGVVRGHYGWVALLGGFLSGVSLGLLGYFFT